MPDNLYKNKSNIKRCFLILTCPLLQKITVGLFHTMVTLSRRDKKSKRKRKLHRLSLSPNRQELALMELEASQDIVVNWVSQVIQEILVWSNSCH